MCATPTCACLRVRVCVPVGIGAYASASNRASLFQRVDRVRLGLQAFYLAFAFNANIGAWNVASVSNMHEVCAAFGRRRAIGGVHAGTLGRSSMRRGRLCTAAPPIRARLHTRIGTG